ncbi:MAG: translocation/assembly module TamB domain-containing protein [bacterium]
MKKLLIISIIVAAVIIAITILINVVDLAKFSIGIFEKTTGYKVIYENIVGSIFKGYTLENYIIKLSPTDSICGKQAQISYRFSPLSFRLPTIFQINLIEPTVNIKKKKTEKEGAKLSMPAMNVSLRINVKNGTIVYENEKIYKIEHISGLIFIDFLGKNIYVTTMNLSLIIPDYPVNIYSANMMLNIGSEKLEAKSFQIKGKGLFLQGNGLYLFDRKDISLVLKTGRIDFDEVGVYQGKVDFQGEINFVRGKLLPRIQGSAQKVYFFDQFKFESNFIADTTIINLFDGQALNGNFSAQIKLPNLKDYTIETNFRNIDIASFIEHDKPVLLNGRLGFKGQKFFGVVNSPRENGLAIETLFVAGSLKNNQIFVDTLGINEDGLSLSAKGMLYPDFDLKISLNILNLEKLQDFCSLKGLVSGVLNLKGKFKELINTRFDVDIAVTEFASGEFCVKKGILKADNFVWKKDIGSVRINLDSASYKNYHCKEIALYIKESNFLLSLNHEDGRFFSKGEIYGEGTGVIDTLTLIYNETEVLNLEPIAFDIFNRRIETLHLRIADGDIRISINENKFSLVNLNLDKLTKFFGLKEKIAGKLNLEFEKNILSVNADSIFYRGLSNGKISINANYLKGKLNVNQLSITDDNGQSLDAHGLASLEQSKMNLKFSNVKPWIFPFLYTFMDSPDGLISGEVDFEGNIRNFKMTGKAEIKNASFGINVISAKFDSGYAQVVFNENQIIFETIKSQTYSGSLSRSVNRSWVTGGGIVKLEPKFRVRNLYFDFSFQDAPLQYQNYAYGIGTGNFSLSMKDEIMSYNGNIKIKEGVIPVEFGTYLEPGVEEEKQEWRMNLKLSGERNIWLRNRDTDIEFGGEVYIIKEQTPLYVSGVLETKRGNYYWLNHILKITSGQITFIPQDVIDPELDFWAEMNTRERDLNTNQEIKIVLHCTGNISEPIFEFFSDPPIYSEQDILTYMNLNITWRELESMKQGEYVGKVLPQTILAWLESDVSRRFRAYTGLDYFRIEAPLFEPEEKTKVTVGKYVSRNLFVTYTYDITSYSNEFNVEYFIDDRNEILIKRDETGEYSLQYQYRIRF